MSEQAGGPGSTSGGASSGRSGGRTSDGSAGRGTRGGSQQRSGASGRGRSGGGKPSGRGPSGNRAAPPRPRLPIDEDVSGRELAPEVRQVLGGLRGLAEPVSKHLVMAGRLLEEDPQRAHEHAQEARRLAARVALVREAAGIAAYAAGHYDVALAEFRAARRMTGDAAYLPVIADCLRGQGRPEKAIELGDDDAVAELTPDDSAELAMVVAGAYRDLGQMDEAVRHLEAIRPGIGSRSPGLTARVTYAYADLLESAGRPQEAVRWFTASVNHDVDGLLDGEERLDHLLEQDPARPIDS